jgi:23S rRNA-/tRNA-specific pseudouridylate synthase
MRLLVHDVVEMPDVWMRDEKRVVWTREDEELAERMRRRVVCEEEGWMAFDKPAGVAVQGGSGVQTHIARILPCRWNVCMINRL